MMKTRWQRWSAKTLKLSLRERVLLLIAGCSVLGFPLYSWWMAPAVLQWQQTKQQIQQLTLQQQEAGSAVTVLQARLAQDPDLAVRTELQTVNSQLLQLDMSLEKQTAGLIPASRMAETLQQMLVRSGKLQLQSLTSMKPTPLLPENSAVNYYRHGVKLVLQGRYADIYAYLQALEALPQHFYWQTLHYHVDKYPQGTVELILYTLGDSKEFIRG
jgi:MSHA biogenesis protein MshJ